MIVLDKVTKLYTGDETPALDDISLHIEPHEFVFLVGKSGAGKSTLIKMITKEEKPDSGKIVIGGIDLAFVKKRHIPHYRRRLGVVYQDYKLLPTRTVFENVAFALEIAGMSNKNIIETVPKVLDLVGLGDKAHKFPAHLSGGEQQRVSIARSVARQPKILIADEPTGNLDKLTRQEIIDLLQKINDFGTTLLVTTHDETIVNNLSKRVVTLKAGRIVNDQKNHGIYRLEGDRTDSETESVRRRAQRATQDEQRIVTPPDFTRETEQAPSLRLQRLAKLKEKLPPIERRPLHSTPAAPKKPVATPAVRAIRAPGAALVGRKANLAPSHQNPKAKKPNLAPSHASSKSLSAPSRIRTQPSPNAQPSQLSPQPKTNATAPAPKLARDSANQWYAASRPLRSAPKLSNLTLGQTVQLRPAPSSYQKNNHNILAHKTPEKRVI